MTETTRPAKTTMFTTRTFTEKVHWPQAKNTHNYVLFHAVSEGQESGDDKGGWFWLIVRRGGSQDVAV